MAEWIARAELARDLAVPYYAVEAWCRRKSWQTRTVSGRSGREVQVYIPSLPEALIARLTAVPKANPICPASYPPPQKPPASNAELSALDRATPEQRQRALTKSRVLELVEQAVDQAAKGTKTKAVQTFLSQFNRGVVDFEAYQVLGPISSRITLLRWREAYEAKGLPGLLDTRGRPRGSATVSQDLKAFIWSCLQANPRIKAAHIYRLLPAKFGRRQFPSEATIRALVARLKDEHRETLEMLHQPSQHKRHYQPSLGRADAGLERPNQRWELDSTRADILARSRHKVIEIVARGGKRYTLIAIIDVFSRRAVALLEEKGGGYNINLALIKAVRRLGLPEEAIMDLGKDYRSNAVQSFCVALGIRTPLIPGHSPELKPHVERFFDTLQSQLLSLLPGYTANKVDTRQEIILPKYSREELQHEIDLWLDAYERREHDQTGQAPLERGNPEGWTRQTVPEEQLRLLLNPPVERSVRQLVIHHNGGRYWHPEIMYLEASSKVLVADDPDDAGLVHVFDQQRRFLFQAEDLERAGLTPERIAEERRAFRRARQLRRREAEETAKALNLAALNRKALRMEIAAAPPVKEAPIEEVDLPEIKAAVEAKAGLSRPRALPTAGERVGGLEFLLEDRREECLEHPSPDPIDPELADDPLPRPAFFDSLSHRARWTMKRIANGLSHTPDDLAALAEFQKTLEYRGIPQQHWEWYAHQLTMDD